MIDPIFETRSMCPDAASRLLFCIALAAYNFLHVHISEPVTVHDLY